MNVLVIRARARTAVRTTEDNRTLPCEGGVVNGGLGTTLEIADEYLWTAQDELLVLARSVWVKPANSRRRLQDDRMKANAVFERLGNDSRGDEACREPIQASRAGARIIEEFAAQVEPAEHAERIHVAERLHRIKDMIDIAIAISLHGLADVVVKGVGDSDGASDARGHQPIGTIPVQRRGEGLLDVGANESHVVPGEQVIAARLWIA